MAFSIPFNPFKKPPQPSLMTTAPPSLAGSPTYMGGGPGYYGQSPNYGIQYDMTPSMTKAQNRYRQLDTVKDTYGKEPSWLDKLNPDALQDLAGLMPPESEKPRFGGAAPVSYGRPRGGNIAPSQSNDPSFAPNPGFGLVLSSREKDRFSGTS